MNPFRSVGGKLAAALVVVVAAALAIVYLIVVPSYRQSLVDAQLADLARSVQASSGELDQYNELYDYFASDQAQQHSARVVVYAYLPLGQVLLPQGDSNSNTSLDVEDDPIARRAARRFAPAEGTVRRGGRDYAEAAYPVGSDTYPDQTGGVILFITPLEQQLQSVAVVRRRFFLAGAAAIAFAALLGYALASMFARRLNRLEAGAERIAGGRFDEPIVDAGDDEVGQLARAFERMRLRLADLDRARSEFIANASHELRTPLFSVAGFLELLEEDLDAETRAEFMMEVRRQIERLTKLATDLLDLSRLDAGRLGVVSEPLDLAELADEVVGEFRARAAASDHVLEVVAPPVYASGDDERVLQIGRILVENAIVHTPAGTTVRVSVALEGGRATLTVADDGPGIPREAWNQVFERFYRLDGSVASGSGLGLAIARELAQLMGGRIELDSQDGWTLFTLVLSAAAPDREPALATEA